MTEKFTKKDLLDIAKWVAIFVIIYWILFHFIFGLETVSGPSMQTTFESGDRVVTLRHTQLKRGDVVILKAPDEPNTLYIKRIIGLPGDSVKVINDQLYINNKKVSEPYLKAGKKLFSPDSNYTGNFSLQSRGLGKKVPKDSYFVMGDHRNVSKDSRYFGYVKKSAIIGKVVLRYWPLNKVQTFN